MLLVNQDGIFDLASFNPGRSRFDTARVFGNRNDFKILVLEFAVNRLPS
jgi:hypothetical protein